MLPQADKIHRAIMSGLACRDKTIELDPHLRKIVIEVFLDSRTHDPVKIRYDLVSEHDLQRE